jgi:hypothetical protein
MKVTLIRGLTMTVATLLAPLLCPLSRRLGITEANLVYITVPIASGAVWYFLNYLEKLTKCD